MYILQYVQCIAMYIGVFHKFLPAFGWFWIILSILGDFLKIVCYIVNLRRTLNILFCKHLKDYLVSLWMIFSSILSFFEDFPKYCQTEAFVRLQCHILSYVGFPKHYPASSWRISSTLFFSFLKIHLYVQLS